MEEGTDAGFLNGGFGVFPHAAKRKEIQDVQLGDLRSCEEGVHPRRATCGLYSSVRPWISKDVTKDVATPLLVSHTPKVRDCSINLINRRNYGNRAVYLSGKDVSQR